MKNTANQEVLPVDNVFSPHTAPAHQKEINTSFPFGDDSTGRTSTRTPGRRNKRAPSREETQTIPFPPVSQSLAYFSPNEQTSANPLAENQTVQPSPPTDDSPSTNHADDHKESPETKTIDTRLAAINERLNRETAKQCFMDAYRKKHHDDNPEGINALIYYFLQHTRFLLSDADQKEIDNLRTKIDFNNQCLQEQKECAENPWNALVSNIIRFFHANYKSKHEKNN